MNLVRADWGANITVPGAWTFFHPDSILRQTPEQIREKFQRQGIRFACYCGGWVDPKHDRKRIGFETGVLDDYWADFRTRLRQAAAKIRQACPEVKVLVYWCYEGNLGTPLGYMSSRMDFGNVVRALEMACLPVGTRYDYPHEISRYLFPFTPIELHRGYLLGRERIITLHSGNYGWPGEACRVAVRHFDRDGKLPKTDLPTARAARTAVQVGPGEAVVIERLPAEG